MGGEEDWDSVSHDYDEESLEDMLEDDHGCGGGRRVDYRDEKDDEPEEDDRGPGDYEASIADLSHQEETNRERLEEWQAEEDEEEDELFLASDDFNELAASERPPVLPMPDTIRHFFEQFVAQPVTCHPATPEWQEHFSMTHWKYHKHFILDRGRADFDEPFRNLGPEDKVLLYCYYNMQMHAASTCYVYEWARRRFRLPSTGPGTVLIDFGAGPLTLGLGLAWDFLVHCGTGKDSRPVLRYIGIEKSRFMTAKAEAVVERSGLFDSSSRFCFVESFRDHQKLCSLIDASGDTAGKERTIILNFSYFLASYSLDVNCLLDIVHVLFRTYATDDFWIVYQNPLGPGFAERWAMFKEGCGRVGIFPAEGDSLWYPNVTNRPEDICRVKLDYELLRRHPRSG
jgi:hypothetical protein